MALVNFTLPFSGIGGTPSWATISPLQTHHATAVNNLLYGPAGHQESDILGQQQNTNQYYKNDPYTQPQQQQQQQPQQQIQNQYRHRTNNNYLPPPPPPQHSALPPTPSPPSTSSLTSSQQQNAQLNSNNNNNINNNNFRQFPPQSTQNQNNYPQQYQQTTRTYGESSYTNISPNRDNSQGYYENYNPQTTRNFMQQPLNSQTVTPIPATQSGSDDNNNNNYNNDNSRGGLDTNVNRNTNPNNNNNGGNTLSDVNENFPGRPPGFTRVQAGQGARTQVHAILDYDDDEEYYDDEDDDEQGNNGNQKTVMPTVTPIQGPIFLKNGTVPVVPLFAYPTVNNGTFVQIPIWWTALSVALGLDIRGDIIRGVPCVKRYHQLFCPTAGNSYPIDKIEKFIDDNKALMRRMYGDFEMSTQYGPPSQSSSKKRKRHTDHYDFDVPGVPDFIGKPGFEPDADTKGESYFNKWRPKRQTQSFRNTNNNSNTNNSNSNRNNNSNSNTNRNTNNNNSNQSGRQAANANNNSENTGRVDACESKVEIVTPYWASNSAGKIRAIVNTQHFEQAIHQEVCVKVQTNRCGGDCGCEQKYKWHRLLAYDPDNDCKGIFMDWFLFPSCCVCRCNP